MLEKYWLVTPAHAVFGALLLEDREDLLVHPRKPPLVNEPTFFIVNFPPGIQAKPVYCVWSIW